MEKRYFIFHVIFFAKTSGEVYKKTKPAARKKAKKSKLWIKYEGFIGNKLTSVQKLLLIKLKINPKCIKRGITKIQSCKRRKQTTKKNNNKQSAVSVQIGALSFSLFLQFLLDPCRNTSDKSKSTASCSSYTINVISFSDVI